ncbi:hypothetical protein CEXT_409291 [Caerostris extrusa]|uniref:Uncharacterized protein n=1 Tax=Caerostris extrusa TaxID=172846 RepID=A0AAV4SEY0_CAEEX|nr:hypothetical protein CEXT_409291 [Caerostris extrusa]
MLREYKEQSENRTGIQYSMNNGSPPSSTPSPPLYTPSFLSEDRIYNNSLQTSLCINEKLISQRSVFGMSYCTLYLKFMSRMSSPLCQRQECANLKKGMVGMLPYGLEFRIHLTRGARSERYKGGYILAFQAKLKLQNK